MIFSTVTGNVGKDAVVRTTGGGAVCNFSVASNTKQRGVESTIWFDCTIWGSRGEKVAPHITKGKRVCVAGEQTEREYEGKIFKCLNVAGFDFMGERQDDSQRGSSRSSASAPTPSGGGYEDTGVPTEDDDIPF